MKKSIYLIALLLVAIPVSANDNLELRGQVYEDVVSTGVDTDPAMPGNQIEWNVNNFAGFYYD
ncbi:MAG: hypothetical protein ACE5KE_07555, partial [Methanosarcinales archaeon]